MIMPMFSLLIFGICLIPDVRGQHLMPVPPQRVLVNNVAQGQFQRPAPSDQPQFRIVQTFNGPFRILTNPSENVNRVPFAPSSSVENLEFRPVAGQPLATHHFNTAPQNPFPPNRPVIGNFGNPGTVPQLRVPSQQIQGFQGPPRPVFQGSSQQLPQGSFHQVLQGPSHQILQAPSHQVPQEPSRQALQEPSRQVLQGPPHQKPIRQGLQGPPDRRSPSLQFPNGTPFQNPGFHNINQPFNVNVFQQQQVQQFRQSQAANGFLSNPFPQTRQTNFPFQGTTSTLPARFTTSPGPKPAHALGNGLPPSSETSTSPTTFQQPFQQNFQRPGEFSSEIPSSIEQHFALSQSPLGPPRFQPTTTARSRHNFQHHDEPRFPGGPPDFRNPQDQPTFIPETSSEFQGPFSTTLPGPGLFLQTGDVPQNLNFQDSFGESFPAENGLPGSKERFSPHGSNFPDSMEFPRAPLSFFGQGFTGFPDAPSSHPTFNSQEFPSGETSSELPPESNSPTTDPGTERPNSQEVQQVPTQSIEPAPTPGDMPLLQFTSEELKPEVLKVIDNDSTPLTNIQSRPTTPNLPQTTSAQFIPPIASAVQQQEKTNGQAGILSAIKEDPSTTVPSHETFPDTDSKAPAQTTSPDFQEQQGVHIETHGPTQRTTSPLTPSPTPKQKSPGNSENLSSPVASRKPLSPGFVAILNNLQQPPAREDQLQRPQSTRGSIKHSTRMLRRPTRIRRIRTTTRRPAQTVEPLQELQTEQQRNSPQVVRDDFHRIPSSPPVVGSDATSCNPSSCQLPNCFCGGNQQIPGGLKPTEVPQMILLTFDDSVNEINYGFYSSLLNEGRHNPNECPISATFYVSHEWTDYGKIQTLYALGHEMASHSISHSDGASFTKERWDKEINGQKRILSALGKVRLEDIKGMRAPFLQGGGNKQFAMLYEANFTYDSSIPANLNNPPTWPYTLDYRMPDECGIPPCPTKAFPGVWEVPMVMWEDLNGGKCAMADACHNPSDARGVYDMLVKNFKRHYTSNRAPFGMFYHYAWFTHPHQQEGFLAFIDALNRLPDVYFVTNSQMLEWMRNPTPLSRIKDFKPWQCKSFLADTCSTPKRCTYRFKGDERQFPTCQPCPEKYPWLETYSSLHITV